MNECFGKKFILNGTLQPSDIFDNSLVYEGESIYEVIRMVKGYPVFFNDHMERLEISLKLLQKEQLADYSTIREAVINLTKSDKKKEASLKIVFNYNKGSDNYLIYFIEPMYPTKEQYLTGVRGTLYYGERNNPESKVINHKFRSSIYHKLILEGGYEALLVNKKNFITEGSRSNIFFVKGDILFTAPDNLILNGITRKHILDICSENKIGVIHKPVKVKDIPEFDTVFMTGTSPIVIPFYCIDNYFFNVAHPYIKRIRNLYFKKAEESVKLFRSE